MAKGVEPKAERVELEASGHILTCSIDKAKPGKAAVKLELDRTSGLVERLADLADRQLTVEVTLRQLQAPLPFAERLEGAGPAEEESSE